MKSFVLLAALCVAPLATASGQTFELEGREVAVYNLVGNIRIESGSGSATTVQVTRAGRDGSRLTVRADRIDGKHTLVVSYPSDDIIAENMRDGSNTNLSVNDDGTFGRFRGGRRVRIRGGDRGDDDALRASAELVVRVPQGVRLEVNLAVGSIDANGTTGDLQLRNSAGDITVAGTQGALDAESASGGIHVNNVNGDLKLESASGGVEINGATSVMVDVEVASGSIRLSDVRAETIDLETASGSIHVTGTRTPVLKAESASGSVRAELDGQVREVELETASGSAEAVLSADFAGEIEMETASGDIEVGFPLTVTTRRRNELRGTVGTGGSAHVYLSSASGDVRLLKR